MLSSLYIPDTQFAHFRGCLVLTVSRALPCKQCFSMGNAEASRLTSSEFNQTYVYCVPTVEASCRCTIKTKPLVHTSLNFTQWSAMATALATSGLYSCSAWHRLQVKAQQNTTADNTLELVCCDLAVSRHIQTSTRLLPNSALDDIIAIHNNKNIIAARFPALGTNLGHWQLTSRVNDVCSKDGRLLPMHNKTNTICAGYTILHTMVGHGY